MFTPAQVIDEVEKFARVRRDEFENYSQALDFVSWQIGFDGYPEMKRSFANLNHDEVITESIKSIKYLCSLRRPSANERYYEFICNGDGKFEYESHWIGWDASGNEVRQPQTSVSCPNLQELRKASKRPIYVLESIDEVRAWMINFNWHGVALINAKVAETIFESLFNLQHLCVENPPLDKVKAQNFQYFDNYVTVDGQEALKRYWSKRKANAQTS